MNKQKSFTLIELLVVIVIIGILAGVIIVSVSSSINKANFAKAQSFSNTVQNELLGDLVSEWTFDIASNPGEDTWGNNDGTLVGANGLPQLQTKENCVYGTCYLFDGVDDYIKTSDNQSLNFGSSMSAFIWVKGNSQLKYILGQYDFAINQRSWVIFAEDNFLRVYLSDNGTLTAGHYKHYKGNKIVFNNSWNFVGFTWNNGILKLYADGAEEIVAKIYDAPIESIHNSTADLTIGCILNNNNLYYSFSGLIDDARVYNSALSSAQIKQQYVAGLDSLYSKGIISESEFNDRISGK